MIGGIGGEEMVRSFSGTLPVESLNVCSLAPVFVYRQPRNGNCCHIGYQGGRCTSPIVHAQYPLWTLND